MLEKVMLSKRIIATLIAGSFAAAQAGAHSYLSDAAGSISDRGYKAQASESTQSENSYPRYLTVFNPDGTSYSLVADASMVNLEPELLVMTSESMPEHLTVFDPDGTVTEYSFTPVDVAYLEPQHLQYDIAALELGEFAAEELASLSDGTQVILVQVGEPIIVAMTDDSSSASRVVLFDAEGAPWSIPIHMTGLAAFDRALETTG
jgi:hypothetical protein